MLHAEFTIWPILVLWALFAVFSSAKKKRLTPPARVVPPAQDGTGLFGEFNRALEELRRAELEAQRPHVPVAKRPAGGAVVRRELWVPKPRPAPARAVRPGGVAVSPPEDAEAVTLETEDHDGAAERLVEARVRAADRGARRDESSKTLAQPSRRAPLTRPRRNVLKRFGSGGVRDAVILSEVLGTPAGLR